MRLLVLFFGLFFIGTGAAMAQTDENPAVWSHEVRQLSDTEYELVFKGKIMEGWHVYSQHTAEGGALPSEFTFEKVGEDYELVGVTEESETITEYSDIFEVDETFFKGEAIFTQKIKLLDPEVNQISVNLFYQICKEVCIPADYLFEISLDGSGFVAEETSLDERSVALGESLKVDLKNKELLQQDGVTDSEGKSNLWVIFGLGFIGGLIALLTPCVFPMIPLTVSFFTKQTKQKSKGIANALLYGFFIVLIYFLLSLPFHLFNSVDSQILNTIATNIWLNVFFFVIFVFFAFSFFGYYELTLPSSWANKMDSASSKVGGGLGIFFMALTLAIVSFSCTGPILGGLLGSTTLAEGNVATNLTSGMVGFGLALALPFALFAMFPAWLNSLPKSGGWMTTVKVVLGFLELALAFKFLSNADLVGNWGILKREIFVGIWVVLFVLMTLYLFGLFRFPHDGPKKNLSPSRKIVGLISFAFTVYLVLGLFKITSLKLLSGFPPPGFYSVVETESDCPLGLDCFKDFEEGVAYAQEVNKPILLDFTGWACVNCRKMEENVWSDPSVYPLLKDEYVLISLYVDDRKELPDSEKFDFKYDSGRVKAIETIGQKWGTFQTINFNAASQPYYVLMSPELEILNEAVQYVDVDTYEDWLKSGLEKHQLSMNK
ncbi:MAG: thioredoxin family protein [Muricauda sp.]|jgi:thiol:disulfide interchange protein DsbD|nr:thioredoxin family protein [Allomuricauda sp.]MBO6531866.1 thioredoxin family protein [Allomuricauda sp.]MBO6589194.1 thioredoxin family protein [Allomuricauda sp.]MBO6618819.1 thioredoxin family protein [Allomuricauda sp.]MBO6644732.1 thioredoxin family protein [Allomuricauda sp.]MBO6746632.1 thioredoxin family protein [Allomuricauda sp.]